MSRTCTPPARREPRLRDAARPASIALLSTYPPTQCGLATFTSALHDHLRRAVGVVRVLDAPEPRTEGQEVVAHLVNGSSRSLRDCVRTLDTYDVVVVQHEYGIYGGPDGIEVLDLVSAVAAPVVVVMHTVLQEPTASQRHILLRLLAVAQAVVTMTVTARDRLVATYGADPALITVIPHGAVDHAALRTTRQPSARPVVLTWGLLGPGKGIEWAVEAMAGLRDLAPRYLVAGKTHPKVLEWQGETYREGLQRRIAECGVEDLVELDDGYLDTAALAALVEAADVVLLPYDSRDQVTSGVLIEAVAAGRPVVSTAFPHAVELLGDGTGSLVPQGDPAAIAAAVRHVLTEPGEGLRMARRAEQKAPELLWGAVAQRYQDLADTLAAATSSAGGTADARTAAPATAAAQ